MARALSFFARLSAVPLCLLAAACGDASATSRPPSTPARSAPAVSVASAASAPVAAQPRTASADDGAPDVPAVTSSGTTLTWYGHSAFRLVTPSGKVLWFDPWIQNPKNPTGRDDLAAIDRADLILVSHAHFDHVGDAVAIAKKTQAKLVATLDVGRALVDFLGFPKESAPLASLGNVGGDVSFFDGEVTVSFVPALHASTVFRDDGSGDPFADARPGGLPGGFVVTIRNGPVVYHTGDTDVFADMATIRRFHKVTVMLACIGDHFTMGPERAAEAVRLVAPAIVVPMHFGTLPRIPGTPEAFEAAVKKEGLRTRVRTMRVHEQIAL